MVAYIMYVLGTHQHTRPVGTWGRSSKELSVPKPEMFERRSDLAGIALTASFVTWGPVTAAVDNCTDTSCTLFGYSPDCYHVLEEVGKFHGEYVHRPIFQALNFTTNYVDLRDYSYGDHVDNGTWTGLVGMLHRWREKFSHCIKR